MALFKSRFFGIEGGGKGGCLSPDEGGASFFRAPVDFKKIAGFEYSLDFFWLLFYVKAKK